MCVIDCGPFGVCFVVIAFAYFVFFGGGGGGGATGTCSWLPLVGGCGTAYEPLKSFPFGGLAMSWSGLVLSDKREPISWVPVEVVAVVAQGPGS